jgi:predicted DNA-binding transcriptional regulator AlpA
MQMKDGRELAIQTDALGRVHMLEVLRLTGWDRKTLADRMRKQQFPAPANADIRSRGQRYVWDFGKVMAWVLKQPGV